jgi:hypothetical protein
VKIPFDKFSSRCFGEREDGEMIWMKEILSDSPMGRARRSGVAMMILSVALVLAAALSTGCGAIRSEGVRTTGDARVTGRDPVIIVRSLVNTYQLVIANFDSVPAEVLVNGNPACFLPPKSTCTREYVASRFSGRNSRAEFLITAFATGFDGEPLSFSRRTRFSSGGRPKAEVDEVRVRFSGYNRRARTMRRMGGVE